MNFLPMLKVASLNLADASGIALLGFVIVIIVLAVLAVFVKLLGGIIGGASNSKPSKKKSQPTPSIAKEPQNVAPATVPVEEKQVEAEVQAQPIEALDLPYTPGYVTLDGVSEQDAAVIMAITSKNTDIPLERLCFKYIRRLNQDPVLENIEEQDAAVVMAIVANKLGKSIENLCFNSIKLVEE